MALRIFAALSLLAVALLRPAAASESLDRLLALVPDPAPRPTQAVVFDFADPRLAASAAVQPPSVALARLAAGFADRERARALTGIDFAAVTGVLVLDEVREEGIGIAGVDGFAGGLPGALEGRGFQRAHRPGGEAFALFDDNAFDPRPPVPGDPFVWRPFPSQRFALSGGVVLWARNWHRLDAMARALAAAPSAATMRFRELERALSRSGAEAELLIAFGIGPAWFLAPAPDLRDVPTTMEGVLAEAQRLRARPPLRIVMQPWTLALLGVEVRAGREQIAVALFYEAAPADAGRGLGMAAQRLAAWVPQMVVPSEPLPLGLVEQRVMPVAGGAVGLLRAQVGTGAPGAAARLLARWRQAVAMQDFAALRLVE